MMLLHGWPWHEMLRQQWSQLSLGPVCPGRTATLLRRRFRRLRSSLNRLGARTPAGWPGDGRRGRGWPCHEAVRHWARQDGGRSLVRGRLWRVDRWLQGGRRPHCSAHGWIVAVAAAGRVSLATVVRGRKMFRREHAFIHVATYRKVSAVTSLGTMEPCL